MANDHARDNHIRSRGTDSAIEALHRRIVDAESANDTERTVYARETESMHASLSELRRLVILFGIVSLIALVLAFSAVLHIITR